MRGVGRKQSQLFSYVSLEERVPRKHLLRLMRKLTMRILAELSPEFEAICAKQGLRIVHRATATEDSRSRSDLTC